MNLKFLIVILVTGLNTCFLSAYGQDSLMVTKDSTSINNNDRVSSYNNLVTIVYDIKVTSNRNKTGIEETYNGGIKTVFVNNDKARVRLVSLMRIQSIFFSSSTKSSDPISVVKESGKKKYKYYLTDAQWNLYNSKYAHDSCQFTNDSLTILNYTCRKAIITLKDGKTLVAYYTNALKPLNKKIEPAFNCIPGLVLQYEYQYKKGGMVYTASKISQDPIASDIFKIPARNYVVKKYCPKCKAKQLANSDNSTID
jgi:GLPGLI family protein